MDAYIKFHANNAAEIAVNTSGSIHRHQAHSLSRYFTIIRLHHPGSSSCGFRKLKPERLALKFMSLTAVAESVCPDRHLTLLSGVFWIFNDDQKWVSQTRDQARAN